MARAGVGTETLPGILDVDAEAMMLTPFRWMFPNTCGDRGSRTAQLPAS